MHIRKYTCQSLFRPKLTNRSFDREVQKCEKRLAELGRKLIHAQKITKHFEAETEHLTAEKESVMLELHFDSEPKRDKHLKAMYKAVTRPICDATPARLPQELHDDVYRYLLGVLTFDYLLEELVFKEPHVVQVLHPDIDMMNSVSHETYGHYPSYFVPTKTPNKVPWRGMPNCCKSAID